MAFLSCIAALAWLLVAASAWGDIGEGDPLPVLILKDDQGRDVELRGDVAPVVIVEIWASWCVPCRKTLPAAAALASRHADRVRLYAVGIDRDASRAAAFLRQHLPSPPSSVIVVRDPENHVGTRFGAQGMPALYAAEDGVVRLVISGAQPDSEERLRRFIEDGQP